MDGYARSCLMRNLLAMELVQLFVGQNVRISRSTRPLSFLKSQQVLRQTNRCLENAFKELESGNLRTARLRINQDCAQRSVSTYRQMSKYRRLRSGAGRGNHERSGGVRAAEITSCVGRTLSALAPPPIRDATSPSRVS
jgi:hypothetical protein